MADHQDESSDELRNDEAEPSPGETPEPSDVETQEEPRKAGPAVAVRYGRMNAVGEFSCPSDFRTKPGSKLVISTERGIEIGEPIDFTCSQCSPCIAREQMRSYSRNSGGDAYQLRSGRVLREATEADLIELNHIERDTNEKLKTCARFAADLELEMKIVDCEHLFGGERIVFYFMAEHRVDFRELVRRLAAEYQTRIEMRQVGARDEARLLADYETCGRECCCRNFLKTLKPINMQMAKLQKATLDPAKVSGRCGRLKCCLRYEHETYDTLVRRMPRVGSRIACREGVGKVIDRQLLTQLVRVLDDDGRLFTIPIDEITQRDLPAPPAAPQEDGGGGRSPARGRRPLLRRPTPPRTSPPTPPGEYDQPVEDEDGLEGDAAEIAPQDDQIVDEVSGDDYAFGPPASPDSSAPQAGSDEESASDTRPSGSEKADGDSSADRPSQMRRRRGRRRGRGRRPPGRG